jgi:HEAT repeat protein
LNYFLRPNQPDYGRRDPAYEIADAIPSWEVDRAVSNLVGAIDHPSARVRIYAEAVLMYLGPRAEKAVPRLIVALNDEDGDVRANAVRVLRRILKAGSAKRNEAVMALTRALYDQYYRVRLDAAEALVEFGETRKAAASLLSACCSGYPDVRESARGTINWANNPAPFVDVLVNVIQGKDRRMRDEVFAALLPNAPRDILLSALRSALADPDPEIRQWAIRHLKSIDTAP